MSVNTRYKDSVFSLLFSDPETLRELYGALEGVTPDKDVPITHSMFIDKIREYRAVMPLEDAVKAGIH
jgi:hypothetical protein